MSLYAKERPEFLCQSLDSVFAQSLPANEIVLVEDGPLSDELYDVLNKYESNHPELKRIALPINGGLGKALNEGLLYCSNDIVARMDTDDIAKPYRFEKQVNFMENHPEISACGSWIDEFVGSPNNVLAIKKVPENNLEIANYAKNRNPLNHPSVVFRKKDVIAAGNYEHFPLFEDYYLWARMISKGYRLHNLQESLIWFRTSPDMYKRRGGWHYAYNAVKFQIKLYQLGVISIIQMIRSSILRSVIYLMPNNIRSLIYTRFLRMKITPPGIISYYTDNYVLAA